MDSRNAHQILIVEDERPIRRFLKVSLENQGYRVVESATGAEALRAAASLPPDLVILDLGLPDLDGQDVLRQLRDWYSGPVIVLSARDQEAQKILALDGGADDYLTKPFGSGELSARIRTAMRHACRQVPQEPMLRTGELAVDLASRVVTCGDRQVHLTPLEYKLLVTLMKNAGKVLTHRQLLNEVWGPHHTLENHYLRVFVASLRRKLEADPARPRYLITEQGIGYRFAAE
ncbi:response regulator [bacterium]|nr:response regulator [bacterium]